jgi:hypothetical protein
MKNPYSKLLSIGNATTNATSFGKGYFGIQQNGRMEDVADVADVADDKSEARP